MEEYCVMCGAVIPEGTHVCVHCGELQETGAGRSGKILPGLLVCKGSRYRVFIEEDRFCISNRRGEEKMACQLREVVRLYHSNRKHFGRYRMVVIPDGQRASYCISYQEKEKEPFQDLNQVLEENCRTMYFPLWYAILYRTAQVIQQVFKNRERLQKS